MSQWLCFEYGSYVSAAIAPLYVPVLHPRLDVELNRPGDKARSGGRGRLNCWPKPAQPTDQDRIRDTRSRADQKFDDLLPAVVRLPAI